MPSAIPSPLFDEGEQPIFLSQSISANRLAELFVALANASGGTLLIGIDPKSGRPEGLHDAEGAVGGALQAALSAQPPLILPIPRPVQIEGDTVLEATVPRGLPHVYSHRGRYLIRSGGHNVPLAAAPLHRLILERGIAGFEAAVPDAATSQDLDWERVEQYARGLPGLAQGTREEALVRRGCLVETGGGRRPTYAGLLLFGRDPQRWVPCSEILIARYAGQTTADQFVKEEIVGTLPDQIRRAVAFVLGNMQRRVRLSGLERVEESEYPVEAVREAIVNAVAHRDYEMRGDEIRILLFSDRVEFYSPGRLAGHVTLENLVDERFSRNVTIVQVLSDMGFVERLGYGIDRMIRLLADAELPAPRFEETAGGFRVTLFSRGRGLIETELDIRHWRRLGLNERQEQALRFLVEKGRITNREYQELCPDVSPETIRRDLADLVSKSLLLRIGDKRATYYILK